MYIKSRSKESPLQTIWTNIKTLFQASWKLIYSVVVLLFVSVRFVVVWTPIQVLTATTRWLVSFSRARHRGSSVLIFFILFSILFFGIESFTYKKFTHLRNDVFFLKNKNAILTGENNSLRLIAADEAHKYEKCNEDLNVTSTRLEECTTELKFQEEVEAKIKADSQVAEAFVSSYRGGASPIKDYINQFYIIDPAKGEIALALSGMESGFGYSDYASTYYNAWGYFCNHGGIRPNCSWQSKPLTEYSEFINEYGLQDASEEEIRWRYAITRYMQASDGYLSLYDGTKGSIGLIANAGYYRVGMDGATQADIDRWVENVYWFTQQL